MFDQDCIKFLVKWDGEAETSQQTPPGKNEEDYVIWKIKI